MKAITFKTPFTLSGYATMTKTERAEYAKELRKLARRGLITEEEYNSVRINMYVAEKRAMGV